MLCYGKIFPLFFYKIRFCVVIFYYLYIFIFLLYTLKIIVRIENKIKAIFTKKDKKYDMLSKQALHTFRAFLLNGILSCVGT